MNYRRWVKIKRVKKFCNNDTSTVKVNDGYNPIYKFDYIWRCLIHNVNFLTKHDELDLYVDDTSLATAIYYGSGAGLTRQISNKTRITKGDHTVLVSDVYCIRTREYRHRHKLHVNPPGWN